MQTIIRYLPKGLAGRDQVMAAVHSIIGEYKSQFGRINGQLVEDKVILQVSKPVEPKQASKTLAEGGGFMGTLNA